MWVVACDKRDDPSTTLFLVDRSLQRRSFWSDRLDDVQVFATRFAAVARMKALTLNNPRVVTLAEAWRIVDAQLGTVSNWREIEYTVDTPSPRIEAAPIPPGAFRVGPERPKPEVFAPPQDVDARWENIVLPDEDDT